MLNRLAAQGLHQRQRVASLRELFPVTVAASTTASAHNLALADAAMYSMAQEHNATLWTQDIDYQGLSGVKYFAKYA